MADSIALLTVSLVHYSNMELEVSDQAARSGDMTIDRHEREGTAMRRSSSTVLLLVPLYSVVLLAPYSSVPAAQYWYCSEWTVQKIEREKGHIRLIRKVKTRRSAMEFEFEKREQTV